MMRITAFALTMTLAMPVLSAAQQRPEPVSPPAVQSDARAPELSPAAVATMQDEAEGPGLLRRVWPGALVGAWVGYFASQITHSDWEDSDVGRAGWTAGGATLGMALGLSLGFHSHAGPSGPTRVVPGPNVLLPDEIASARAPTAWDLLHNLRPAWFVIRGTASFRESARGELSGTGGHVTGSVTEGIEQIGVYMDNVRLGGVDELRSLPIDGFIWARFLTASEATARWGSGNVHGAIQLLTSVPNT